MEDRPPMLPVLQQPRKGPVRKGRRKIDIEYIPDKTRRHVTFSKRKGGIMKKAYELATLTGTQVLLLVASETGHVYTFATPKLQPLITGPEGKNLIQTCLNVPDEPAMSEMGASQGGGKNLGGGSGSGSDSEGDGGPHHGVNGPGGDFKVHPYHHKKDSLDDDQSSPEQQVHPKMEKLPDMPISGYVPLGPSSSPLYPGLPQLFPHQMQNMPYHPHPSQMYHRPEHMGPGGPRFQGLPHPPMGGMPPPQLDHMGGPPMGMGNPYGDHHPNNNDQDY